MFTGDIALYILTSLQKYFPAPEQGILGKIVTATIFRPAPLLLLASGAFYLWVYVTRVRNGRATAPSSSPLSAPQ